MCSGRNDARPIVLIGAPFGTLCNCFLWFRRYPNAQWAYPNGTWEQQQRVVADFKQYALGLIHFAKTDPAVPADTRARMATFGLCKDEYNRSADHWMPQLYVRTALRMVGSTVLTQKDVTAAEWRSVPDGIGVASYTVDVPGMPPRLTL